MSDAEQLALAIEGVGQGLLLVVTGAGISLASGIPTFRGTDPGAVWKKDVTELGTFRYFREDPVGSWTWYTSRFDLVLDAKPNPAHSALVDLERWQQERGDFLLVTQNIDTLHSQAGSQALVEVHGRGDRVRCATAKCPHGSPSGSILRSDVDLAPFLAAPDHDKLPRCPACEDILRQHVLWFDEYYQSHDDYQWDRVQLAAMTCDLAVFVGTSLSVGVTELVLRASLQRNKPVIAIDPGRGPDPSAAVHLKAKAEELLPKVVELLGRKSQ